MLICHLYLQVNLWDKLNPTTRHKEEQERVHGDGDQTTSDTHLKLLIMANNHSTRIQ